MHRINPQNLLTAIILGLLPTFAGCGPAATTLPIFPTSAQTYPGLGRAQGVTVFGEKVFLYGDAQTGVLREYTLSRNPLRFDPTSRAILLTRGGVNLLNHPTGLALHDAMPCFLGNTVTATKQGTIYRLDLARAFADANLDHAILNETLDDLAVQGSRPEYVQFHGRNLLATSDYGPGPNFVRFYDPAILATASKTSDPGVLVRKIPCGPWVQLLHYIEQTHTLVIVQNIVEGRQWRLTLVSNLEAQDYRSGPDIRVIDIPGHDDELEGYAQIDSALAVLITSSREHNVTFATTQPAN